MQFSQAELDLLAEHRPHTATRWLGRGRRVQAFAVVDHGGRPALGEVRMGSADELSSLRLACRLARSTSIRAGLLGVPRAGAAVVVVDDPELDRDALGQLLVDRLPSSELRARAGSGMDDLGSLDVLAPVTESALAELRASVLEICSAPLGLPKAAKALVLGADEVGRDAAKALVACGHAVGVWDEDEARARALAEPIGATAHVGSWVDVEVDLLVPCTLARVLEARHVELVASRICGLVPWVVDDVKTGRALEERGTWLVPPLLGAAAEVLALAEAEGLLTREAGLARLREAAAEVLATPQGAGSRALSLAIERAQAAGAG